MTQPRLMIVPTSLREANIFVEQYHRHHGPSSGHKFSIAVAEEIECTECGGQVYRKSDDGKAPCRACGGRGKASGMIHGVAIAGRPIARYLDDNWTLEVRRVATDGCPNACSALYSACWRAGRAMGYLRAITYILESESGTSLTAAGWKLIGQAGGVSWNMPSRPRVDKSPVQTRLRWEVTV